MQSTRQRAVCSKARGQWHSGCAIVLCLASRSLNQSKASPSLQNLQETQVQSAPGWSRVLPILLPRCKRHDGRSSGAVPPTETCSATEESHGPRRWGFTRKREYSKFQWGEIRHSATQAGSRVALGHIANYRESLHLCPQRCGEAAEASTAPRTPEAARNGQVQPFALPD